MKDSFIKKYSQDFLNLTSKHSHLEEMRKRIKYLTTGEELGAFLVFYSQYFPSFRKITFDELYKLKDNSPNGQKIAMMRAIEKL